MRWRKVVLGALLGLTVLLTFPRSQHPAVRGTTGPSSTSMSTTTSLPATTTSTSTTAVPVAGQCPAVMPRRAMDPNRPRYTVRVEADPTSGLVRGDMTVRFTPDLPIDQLVFRLWPNGPRPASVGAHLSVGDAISEGAVLTARQPDPTTLELVLAEPIRAGRVIEVSLPFTLQVPGSASDRISRSDDSLRLGSFLPLLAWEPGVGWSREPPTSGFAEATSSPAADWHVAITTPAGYDVLASGSRGADGAWALSGARDFAITVGHFTIATAVAHAPDPVEVTVGVHRGIAESPALYVRRIVAALETHASRFGPYAWTTYTMAVTPGLQGGIEFPTHVMQGPKTSGRTTPHEAAHMWFYALVGNNQGRDPWMDEGLASYAEARFEGTLDLFRAEAIPITGKGRAGEPMTYWEPRLSAYYRSVYVQGAVGIASLGSVDLVDCALRHYVDANAYRIATPADLLAAVQVVFPDAAARLAPYGLP